jgi:hypothetical protein
VQIDGRRHDGDAIQGIYTRMMDDQLLPDTAALRPDDPTRARCRALHLLLAEFIDQSRGRVLNRTAAMSGNCSKPFQARLVRAHGFATPDTLITNEPELVRDFAARHKRVIFKSMSGQRSIVPELSGVWLDRLDAITGRVRWRHVALGATIAVTILHALGVPMPLGW